MPAPAHVTIGGVTYPASVADELSAGSVIFCAGVDQTTLAHDLELAERVDFPTVHMFDPSPASERVITQVRALLDRHPGEIAEYPPWNQIAKLRVPSASLLHHKLSLTAAAGASSVPASPTPSRSLTLAAATQRLGCGGVDLLRLYGGVEVCEMLETMLEKCEGGGSDPGSTPLPRSSILPLPRSSIMPLPRYLVLFWRPVPSSSTYATRRQRIVDVLHAIGYRAAGGETSERADRTCWRRE